MTNIALIVAVLCTVLLVVRAVRQTQGQNARQFVNWVALALGGLGTVFAFNLEALGPWKLAVSGLCCGLAVSMAVMDFPDSDLPAALGAPLGLAAVLLGVFSNEVNGMPLFALAFVAGIGATAGILALQQRARAAVLFCGTVIVGLAAVVLATSMSPTEGSQTVVNVLAVALLALVLGEGLGMLTKKTTLGWPQFATALVFSGLTYFVTVKSADLPDLPLVAAVSGLAAVIVTTLTKSIKDQTISVLVGALVWLGIATAAFSFAKGYGLAVAALVGLCASALAGERRPLVWTAPMMAILIYRLARFVFPDVTRAFDIGQHYAIVGLVLGLLLPLLIVEWGRSVAHKGGWATTLAAVLSGAAVLIGTSLAVAFLGAKGASGLVIGFAVSPAISSLKGESSKTALSTGLGLSAWAVVSIGALAAENDLARPDKVRMVLTIGGLVALLIVSAMALTRFKKESVA